jgi:hypothetical protein
VELLERSGKKRQDQDQDQGKIKLTNKGRGRNHLQNNDVQMKM